MPGGGYGQTGCRSQQGGQRAGGLQVLQDIDLFGFGVALRKLDGNRLLARAANGDLQRPHALRVGFPVFPAPPTLEPCSSAVHDSCEMTPSIDNRIFAAAHRQFIKTPNVSPPKPASWNEGIRGFKIRAKERKKRQAAARYALATSYSCCLNLRALKMYSLASPGNNARFLPSAAKYQLAQPEVHTVCFIRRCSFSL